MDDKRDIIDEIENFKDQFPLNAEDTKKAEDLTRELYGGNAPASEGKSDVLAASRKRNIVIWCVSVFLVCALFLAIFLPLVLRDGKNDLIYYNNEQIRFVEVDDIEDFIVSNELNFKYYKGTSLSNTYQAGYITETNQLAFIQQESMVITQNGFDMLGVNVVFIEGRFKEFDDFSELVLETTVNDIQVQYKEAEQVDGSCILYASFRLDSLVYYLQVTTQSAEGKLETYIGALV